LEQPVFGCLVSLLVIKATKNIDSTTASLLTFVPLDLDRGAALPGTPGRPTSLMPGAAKAWSFVLF